MWRVVYDSKFKKGDVVMFTNEAFFDEREGREARTHFDCTTVPHGTKGCPWMGEIIDIGYSLYLIKMDDDFLASVYKDKVWGPDVVDENGELIIEYDVPPEE
ncbi:MAG: hypothetical protein MJZ20_07020 [Bacteroidaceae bacterium]|nr:hypothetical protein [Bacteroidaceae bacterium]